jgi:mono/diheme cytochrome c family protein
MSKQNPHVESPKPPPHDVALQPKSPDFIETPEIEPLSTEKEPLPIWVYLVCGVALFLTGSSFTGFQIFGNDLLDQGPGGPTLSSSSQQAVAPETPIEKGKKIFGQNCASCHQASGVGQPGQYPPLVKSEWVLGSKERLAAILLKGLQGAVTVDNSTFSTMVMPAQESVLSPEKLADLMTYIRGSWGNTAGPVTVDEVNAAKTKLTSRTTAYSEAELLQIAPNGPDPTDKK